METTIKISNALIWPDGSIWDDPSPAIVSDRLAEFEASNLLRLEAQRQLLASQGWPDAWDTDALTRDFKVKSFTYGICFVERKSDGMAGSLDFTDSPRLYYHFLPDTRTMRLR